MLSNLTPAQKALATYMSSVSEAAYCASWMSGLEFALWQCVVHGPYRYGQTELTSEHVSTLDKLSSNCGGWIYFDDEREETYTNWRDWLERVRQADHQPHRSA